ncbi:MAG: hypothetical protein Ct9H90mP16_03060 [Candidatus Poseidoniales archaeon]|nr:MAG: hypothetical protein Ct9H90mP16_03060 [Candidatus Poseidoniales archaeon]
MARDSIPTLDLREYTDGDEDSERHLLKKWERRLKTSASSL